MPSRVAAIADSPLFVSPRMSSASSWCSSIAASERVMISPICSPTRSAGIPMYRSASGRPSSEKKMSDRSGS